MKYLLLSAGITALMIGHQAWALHADNAHANLMEAHEKMMKSMHDMKSTGNADKDFVMMMIPHHQGAIDMAQVELKFGTDEKLRAMAQEIIEAQEKEIREMQDWQTANP